jgi:hypothetical protein
MMDTRMILLLIGGSILALLLAALLLILFLGVPWQAYRRGHGFISWFILQIISTNPVYPLVLIALLPDKRKSRLREEFRRELDARLGDSQPRTRTLTLESGKPLQSIGDLPTAGVSVGDLPTYGASVGNLPTAAPAQSIGNAETRDPEG